MRRRGRDLGVAGMLVGREAELAAIAAGPAQAAGALLEGGLFEADPWPTDQGYPLIHGLFWLASNLSSLAPLVMLVDDAHWSDAPSLRFLSYLTIRLADLPIVLIVAVTQGEPAADQEALIALATAPTAVTIRPGPISHHGIESIVHSQLPEAEDEFIAEIGRAHV